MKIEFGIPKDQQEAKVLFHCQVSGDEIYEGNSYIETKNGGIIKDDIETLIEYIDATRKYAGEEEVGD